MSICPSVGNEELVHEEIIEVYPNPVSNQLNIDATQFSLREVRIINNTGALIKEITTDLNQIDVSDLPSGIYFINLVGEEGSVNKRFVKY